jgi:hypothetical protein
LVREPKVDDTSALVNVVTDSVTVKVTVLVAPDDIEDGFVLIDTVGREVSYVIEVVLLRVLLLPAVSENRVLATERAPVPAFVLAVGVKTTEYTVEDVVVSAPMVPPVTVMSSAAKVDDASESVNVIVSV